MNKRDNLWTTNVEFKKSVTLVIANEKTLLKIFTFTIFYIFTFAFETQFRVGLKKPCLLREANKTAVIGGIQS